MDNTGTVHSPCIKCRVDSTYCLTERQHNINYLWWTHITGISLVLCWLRLQAGARVQSLVRELDPQIQTKSSHATTKDPISHASNTWCSQTNVCFKLQFRASLVVQWLRTHVAIQGAGWIPGLGKSHISWGNKAHMPQLLSLCSRPNNCTY